MSLTIQDFSKEAPHTDALRDWLKRQTGQGPTVLVTHQVNITAYTGVYPRSGEIILFRLDEDGAPVVLKRVLTEDLE